MPDSSNKKFDAANRMLAGLAEFVSWGKREMVVLRWLALGRRRFDSLARSSRVFYGLVAALTAISLADVAILALRSGPSYKTGPNTFASPWDVSKAPPQLLRRGEVRVVKMKTSAAPPAEQALGWPKRPKRQAKNVPIQRAAAFAPFVTASHPRIAD